MHHQLCPLEENDAWSNDATYIMNNQELFPMCEDIQVVSFLVPTHSYIYLFSYDDVRNRTCLWIDHELHESPQLLVFLDFIIEFECCNIMFYLVEYKDEFEFLRTITITLLLVHALQNLTRVGASFPSLNVVHFESFVHSLV